MSNESKLAKIVGWVRREGDVAAFSRLRLKMLPLTIKEGICLDPIDANTQCSASYLDAIRTRAQEVVGQNCPF